MNEQHSTVQERGEVQYMSGDSFSKQDLSCFFKA